MTSSTLTITPVSEHVGAEVSGVDLANLDDAALQTIVDAWGEYGVLFFRDQALTSPQHIAFAERIAPIDVNKFFTPVDGYPQIAEVRKEPDQDVNIGGGWHTDHSYDPAPARGSILLAREVPPEGGDTKFMSVGAAYDGLPDDLKKTISTLRANHSNAHIFGPESKHAKEVGHRLQNPDHVGGTTHPLVIAHPQTGRKMLYVNAAFVTGIVGWSEDDSNELLATLYEHLVRPEYSYQFSWEVGSIAMWDNLATWHWALNDYHGHRRLMHRITVEGVELSAAA